MTKPDLIWKLTGEKITWEDTSDLEYFEGEIKNRQIHVSFLGWRQGPKWTASFAYGVFRYYAHNPQEALDLLADELTKQLKAIKEAVGDAS
jgi:hypothetical protein